MSSGIAKHQEDCAIRNGVYLLYLHGRVITHIVAIDTFTGDSLWVGTKEWVTSELEKRDIKYEWVSK